jgi:hypothetical protein
LEDFGLTANWTFLPQAMANQHRMVLVEVLKELWHVITRPLSEQITTPNYMKWIKHPFWFSAAVDMIHVRESLKNDLTMMSMKTLSTDEFFSSSKVIR